MNLNIVDTNQGILSGVVYMKMLLNHTFVALP